MSTDSGVPPQAHQGFLLVLGDDIHGCGVACACGVEAYEVEVGRSVAPAAVAAVEAAIVAAV